MHLHSTRQKREQSDKPHRRGLDRNLALGLRTASRSSQECEHRYDMPCAQRHFLAHALCALDCLLVD